MPLTAGLENVLPSETQARMSCGHFVDVEPESESGERHFLVHVQTPHLANVYFSQDCRPESFAANGCTVAFFFLSAAFSFLVSQRRLSL